MTVSDRFLVALGAYLQQCEALAGREYSPRLRDWDGWQGPSELILDADEPEEHETLRGNYALDAVVALSLHPRDSAPEERRELLGELAEALADTEALVEFLSDAENEARGLGIGELLIVWEVRTNDGTWDVEEDRIIGKVEVAAMICG
jgi:hypothetical protein